MATKYSAYAGKVLKIDLTTRKEEEYPFTDKQRELFLGGKIMAAKILYDNIKGPIDPLSPENMLIVTSCPLNGLGAPSSSRFNISGVSPLTGLVTSSNCGGNFGIHLKRAGYDALIIVGKSEEKIYIEINDGKVVYKNADELWGLHTGKTQEVLGGKRGKIVIGPAGENMVRYACIVSEERAAGRGGMGALMGSKNLKAVVASGTNLVKVKNVDKYRKLCIKWTNRLKTHPLTGVQLPKLGTAGLLTTMNTRHILATKNFSQGQFEGYEKISGEELTEKHLIRNVGCLTCPIQCARVVNVKGKEVKGPEVETLGLLGANILNDNMEKILEWNNELDELGMDTISLAGTIAFAMELNEKGVWNNGLSFGKIDNLSDMFDKIAHREGEVGNLLAEGTKRLGEKFGGKEYCINAKGMELAAYEPRGAVGQGLGYAIANRGGCHINAGYLVVLEGLGLSIDPYTHKGKASISMTFQDLMESVSAGGNCIFTTYAFFPQFLLTKPNGIVSRIVNYLMPHLGGALYFAGKHPLLLKVNLKGMLPQPVAIRYATGMKLNFGAMLRIGERGYNMERIVNIRLGLTTEMDSLPKRLTDDLQDTNNPKSKVPLDIMKKRYYKTRGWDEKGVPTQKLIKKLKIED